MWEKNPTKPAGFGLTSVTATIELGKKTEGERTEAADDEDTGAAGSSPSKSPRSPKDKVESPKGDAAADADADGNEGGDKKLSKEDMDALLLKSFLQAAKTTLKDKELPLDINT